MLSEKEKFANWCCHFRHHTVKLRLIYNLSSLIITEGDASCNVFLRHKADFDVCVLGEMRHSHREAVPPPVGTDLLQCSKQPMQIYTAPVAHAHTHTRSHTHTRTSASSCTEQHTLNHAYDCNSCIAHIRHIILHAPIHSQKRIHIHIFQTHFSTK